MAREFLLDVSPTGVQHSVAFEDDYLYTVEHTPDVVEQEIVDSCSRLRGLHQRSKSNFRFAGRVPINTYTAWKKEWKEKYHKQVTWPTFLAQKMNSREYSKLNIGCKLPTAQRRHV